MEDTKFPPSYFNDSSMNKVLSEKEIKILRISKTDPRYKGIYDNFNQEFGLYLSKLPDNNVKKYVSEIFNRNIVNLGVSVVKDDGVFVRVIETESTLLGIVLDISDLDIDFKTGNSSRIDDCIYASYFGLIRAAILLNKTEVRQDKDLHKALSTYIYLMFLKSLGKTNVYTQKQKAFIHIVTMYAYYKHFLKERHPYILKILRDHFKELKLTDFLDEFEPRLKDLEKYNDIKDIPKMFIDTRTLIDNPNQIVLALLKNLRTNGFYSFTGPLDQLAGMVVVSKYPTGLYNKDCLVNEDVHNQVEKIIIGYIEKIKFDASRLK
jgi:hypothetical protein